MRVVSLLDFALKFHLLTATTKRLAPRQTTRVARYTGAMRPRLSPPALWWVSLLLPPFLILDGWVLDVGAIYATNHYGSTATEMYTAYLWWSRYDWVAKWGVSALVAAILMANHARSAALGRARQWAPWLVVLVLLGVECTLRGDFNGPTPVGAVVRDYLVSPPRWEVIETPNHDNYSNSILVMRIGSPTSGQTLRWTVRPLLAFAVAMLGLWLWRAWLGRFWSHGSVRRRGMKELEAKM